MTRKNIHAENNIEQILMAWNNTHKEYPGPECLHQLVEEQVERTPDATAVVHQGKSISYHELNTRSNQLAHQLQALGVGPDVPVAICLERCIEMTIGVLAILKAGGGYVSLDPAYPQERLAYMLQDCRAPVLLTQHSLAGVFPAANQHIIRLDTDWAKIANLPSNNPVSGVGPQNLLYILYTSGSTGKPKGVSMIHRPLVNLLRWQAEATTLTGPARTLQFASLGFDVSCQEIFFTWSQGGALVLIPEETRRDGYAMLQFLADSGVEQLFLPFVALQNLAQAALDEGIPPHLQLKEIVTAGEQLQATPTMKEFFRRLPGCALHNQYGPTEAHVVTAFTLPGDPNSWATLPPIGKPVANTQMYILDAEFQPVPVGEPGELYIAGDCLARGYLNRPELTCEKFIPNPFLSLGEMGQGIRESRMYRTGDLARWLPDGNIEYLGRMDQQVKIRGFRVELGEIEAALRQHPAIKASAVLAREDTPGQRRLAAYVVLQQGQTLEITSLRAHLKNQLPEYMVPALFVQLEALPLTRNGKVDRKALPAPDASNTVEQTKYTAPRTPTETALADAWAEVLKLDRVGIHDNFFDLGGHSLLATQVVSRLRRALGVELPIRSLFETASLAELAQQLEKTQQTGSAAIQPVSRENPIPLSFAQQRLWFLDQFERGSVTYNIPATLQLRGKLDIPALEHAFAELILRHESLRTVFANEGGQPTQRILPAQGFDLPLVDLTALPPEQRNAETGQIATREARAPFDLATGPLVRARLLRLSPHEHILLLNMHHIISDGWSLDIFNEELARLYAAFTADPAAESPIPPLPIQYADFSAWQRDWLAGETLERQIAHWRKQLSGSPALLELPTDRPRPARQTFNGHTLRFQLSPELTRALQTLSRQHNATLFMTLYAAFAALLSRYSRQDDIVIGSGVANRNRAEVENLIGFFVNTLALRANFSGNPTFAQLLTQARQTTLDAYAHQDIPFEKLVEELRPERSLSYSPICQVMFVMQTVTGYRLEMPGLEIHSLPIETGTAKFDLTLDMTENENGLFGFFEYNTDLFDESTIRRMIGHFETLLAGITTNPSLPISALPLLTEAEKQTLAAWNNTLTDYPQNKTIHQLFEEQAAANPDQIALVFDPNNPRASGQTLTYGELNQRANQLAHHLQKLGIGPDVLVGVCIERSFEMVIALYAILKAGGAYVPIDPTYPPDRIAYMLHDSQPRVLLTGAKQARLAQELVSLENTVVLDLEKDWPQVATQSIENLAISLQPHNLAYMIYTSGSTGKPKGAMNTHAAIFNRLAWMQDTFQITPEDRVLQKTPFSFDVSVWEFFWPLMFGARLVIARPEGHKDPQYLVDTIQREGITTLHFVPSMLAAFLDARNISACASLRQVICSGEALPPDLVRRFFERSQAELHNLYGPTEAAVDVSWWPCQPEAARTSIPIGKPIANIQLHILDTHFDPVPVGVAGELCISGIGLARGYLNRAELTADKFIPNPFSNEAGARMYRTGDLARWLPNGNIEYLGRMDHQVKIRGFRIELGEIEAVLNQFSSVKEAVVVVREDTPNEPLTGRGKRIVAYFTTQTGNPLEINELRAHLLASLPEYMVPAAFVCLPAMPLSPNGKVDRKALPAPTRNATTADIIAPRTPTEQTLAGIWAEVLKLEHFSVTDNFFDLGGHSLLATQVVSRLRQAADVELPVRAIFEAPTLGVLAQIIESTQKSSEEAIPPVSRKQPIPLSFAQQRLWFLDQLEGSNAAYHIAATYHLRGILNESALEAALGEIVCRHEILRTTFNNRDGQPFQKIEPYSGFSLPAVDFTKLLPQTQQAEESQKWVIHEAKRPFDLATGPLLRACLLKLAPDHHILLFTMHHAISDGWSLGIFNHELSILYTAISERKPWQLPNLSVQYADFSAWQRNWLSGNRLEAQLSYWKNQLSDAPILLELPTDRPRSAVQTPHGRTISFTLTKELTQTLATLARRENASLFMALYSAFAILLNRYSRQNDLVIGAPIANRNRAEIEPLIGSFVNTLALRTDLSGNPTFTALLARIRQMMLDAYNHQDIPFEKLVEELKPERSLSHSPIFQVMFAMQDKTQLELPGLEVIPFEFESATAQFDLTLTLEESAQGLNGSFEYNTDLFDESTICRMIGHWQTLLTAIATNPGQKIADFPLLTQPEQEQILQEWSHATAASLGDHRPAHQLFEEQARHAPNQVALIFENQSLTYHELDARSNQLAHRLKKRGLRPETVVGLCLERSPEMIVGLLGILKAGCVYLPLDPSYPSERLAFMLRDSKVALALTQSSLADRLTGLVPDLLLLDSDPALAEEITTPISAITQGNNLAYIIYTSGSTGKPKGVQVEHLSLAMHCLAMREYYRLTPQDRVLQFASISFDTSLEQILPPLVAGAGVIIQDGNLWTPATFYEKTTALGLTVVDLPPAYWHQLLQDAPAQAAPSLRLVIVGGEALQPASLALWRQSPLAAIRLVNAYGPTETTITATCAEFLPRPDENQRVSIGKPLTGTRIYILDPQGQPVPTGVPGELCIGGSRLARGYLNQPALTAEKFCPDPFARQPGNRMYRTGDLARWLPNGEVEFLGRVDEQVKLRGFRIELGEIETALAQIPGISESAVVLWQEGSDWQLAAYLISGKGEGVTTNELRDHLKNKLPGYMIPTAFTWLQALPRTPNGKLDRKALPAPNTSLTTGVYTAPVTLAEEILATIWSDVLKREKISIHNNFFDLGGHSLLATQVVSRIRQVFAVELPVRALFESPTISELAAQLVPAPHASSASIQPIQRGQTLPLSFAQQRLWFLDQYEGPSATYNIPVAYRFQGNLDEATLKRAFLKVIQRHETLRTVFSSQDEQPTQHILPDPGFDLPLVDLTTLSPQQRNQEVDRLSNHEMTRPFDLSTGPLLRASLLKLAQDDHLLLLNLHHIVADGWSVDVLNRELTALLAGSSPPELSIQYADYAAWQRAWLQGEILEKQLDFWKRHLAGAPALLELPTDRPRPARQTFTGRTLAFTLDPAISLKLRALSRQYKTTLFMTFYAAFAVLLSRYSRQYDIVIGSPVANRNRAQVENLIGFFVNTLALRADLSGDPSFASLLAQVRKTTLEAYDHQDIPFEKLVEELRPERSLSYPPIFQVMFALQNTPESELSIPGLQISNLTLETAIAKFDLALEIIESESNLAGSFEYNTDLFDEATIRRMIGHFQTLLAGIAANPTHPISALPLLTEQEKQALAAWSKIENEYKENKTIHQLVEEQAQQNPENIALIFDPNSPGASGQTLSYRELNTRANQLAHYLKSLGVGPDVLVGICVERSFEMVIGLLGILKAGGAYLPIDPEYPAERIAYILSDAQTALVLTQERLLKHLPKEKHIFCIDRDWGSLAHERQENPSIHTDPKNLAYVIYTSGSTGRPKGSMITHHNVVRLLWVTDDWYHFGPSDAWTLFHSFAFDFSVWEIWGALAYGGSLVIVPYLTSRSPHEFYQLLCKNQVTVLNQTPSAFRQLIAAQKDLPGLSHQLRTVIFGGEALETGMLRPWYDDRRNQASQLVNMYGITETTVHVTYRPVDDTDTERLGASPIGRAIPDQSIYILDSRLTPVPVGIAGEMFVGGAGSARGYLNRPGLTAERFIPNPFSNEPGSRMYRTGDLARWLPNGELEYLGRIDQQVKIRGFRIELGEIESVLAQYPGIQEAVVVALEDRSSAGAGKQLAAYLVARGNPQPNAAALRAHLREKLPPYMVPAAFVFLESFPLTTNGKLDRRALPAPDMAGAASEGEYLPPRTPAEKTLAAIWAEVLRLEQVSVTDNFFDLGGHSLLATQVVSRMRKDWGVDLPVRAIFETPNLEDLAQLLENAHPSSEEAIPLASREQPIPLSFAQQRLWFLEQLKGGSATYNIPLALQLQGTLNVPALEKAFAELIQRHEPLRTIFIEVDDQPAQRILPPQLFALHIQTLAGEAEAQREILLEAETPFDLALGPLLRARLLQLAPDQHILLITMHHIISDGWSISVLARELASLYAAFAQGKPPHLEPLPIQYADFAAWQRHWLQGAALEKQLSYWKSQLSDAPTLLELPTDRPRPAVQTFTGRSIHFAVGTDLANSLQAICRKYNVTPFMAFYAAFAVLLARYSRQNDIAIGAPLANRNRREIEPLIGFFVNTLALRADLSGNPTFIELLRQVQHTTLEAYAHQDLPFEKLVEELHPERSLSYSPIFQVAFVMQNNPSGELSLPGLEITPIPVHNATAKFDLSLGIEETETGFSGGLEYNTDLFNDATIQRMVGHWQTLLQAIAANPSEKVSRLPLLTEPEHRQILWEWNSSAAAFPPARPIHQLVEAWAQASPNQPAVVFGSQSITYHELDSRANQLARRLQRFGIGPDAPIAVCAERSIEMIIGLLGILKAGGAYAPIDPEYPPERIAYILQDSASPLVLTQNHLMGQFSGLRKHILCLDQDWPTIAQESEEKPSSPVSVDHLAYIIYTSGSTGQPKGVQVTHRALGNLIGWHCRAFGLSAKDHATQVAGSAFDASAWEIWPCLAAGACLHIADNATRLSPFALRDWLLEHRISLSFLPTPLAESILGLDWPDQAALRFLLTGGDMLHHHPRPGLPFQVVNNYGPTENTVVSTSGLVPARPDTQLAPSIGRPISNVQTYILDSEFQPVPVGVAGELCVAGDNLARGYLNRPDLTVEKFVPNPFSDKPGSRMYRTGDLARWLPTSPGEIEFLGRIDQQVKIRGFRIELGEIEAALAAHPAVLECVVLARQDSPAVKQLVAYAVPHTGKTLDADSLRAHLKTKLPPYMLPAAFVPLESMPLTANGKVDRRALPAPAASAISTGFSPPRSDLEKKIAAAWQKTLGNAQIGLDDNFFSSGGDSLKVIQAVHHLEYACSVMEIFERQTVRELAEHLSRQQKAGESQKSRLLYELTPRITPQQRTLSLVCFPPAGGNAIVYKDLAEHLPQGYSLYAVEMPGHDIHNPDEALLSWPELAALCLAEIKSTISGPIALYGHSAGASLALEVARLLEQENLPLTDVTLGANFPNARVSAGIFRKLNLERLVSDRTYEDAQRQVVGSLFDEFDPQARAVRTRSWRHDGLENTEYYTFAAERWQGQKLKARITSVVGEKDRGTEFYTEQVSDWRAFGDQVRLRVIPRAGHYFMKHQAAELAAILTQADETTLPTASAPRAEQRRSGVAQFMTVASGQFISTIGTIMSAFALGAWVYKTTGSVTNLGVVSFFEVLPLLLLLPVAGAVADRWDRRKILLLCDGAAILNTLLLGLLLFTGSLQLWHLWLCAGVYATISAFQQPAYLAGVAQLVPKRYLGQANGFVQLGQAAGNVLAPLLGGVLIEAVSLPGVVALDLFTYLFSFTCLALTPFPNALFKKEEEPVVKAIMGGWKYLLRRRGLLGLAVYFAGMNVGNSALSVLLIPYVLSMSTGNWLGLALANWGLGMALGSLVMIVWGGLRQRVHGIIGAIIAMSAFTVLAGFATSPWLLCLGLLGNGLCFSLAAGHFYPLLQVKVGDELLGRILSTFRMISYSSLPLAYLLVGPLADGVFTPLTGDPSRGMGLLLITVGALVIAWSLLAFLHRPLRRIETDIPDALMDAVIYDDKDAMQQQADRTQNDRKR